MSRLAWFIVFFFVLFFISLAAYAVVVKLFYWGDKSGPPKSK